MYRPARGPFAVTFCRTWLMGLLGGDMLILLCHYDVMHKCGIQMGKLTDNITTAHTALVHSRSRCVAKTYKIGSGLKRAESNIEWTVYYALLLTNIDKILVINNFSQMMVYIAETAIRLFYIIMHLKGSGWGGLGWLTGSALFGHAHCDRVWAPICQIDGVCCQNIWAYHESPCSILALILTT